MDDELIQFKKVTKRFGRNTVLNSIDLTIPEGKITGIIGASGEGKSTILKMLASFYKPTSGEILYMRKNLMSNLKDIYSFFGLAIEDGSYYEMLTVRENLYHFGRLYGVKSKILNKRIQEIMSLIELEKAENTLAKNLSLGMRKRLDIACSLVHNPVILILDEPTADLDPLLRKQMIELIKKINFHKTTIVLTTQLLEEVDGLCDNVAILYNEKIVDEGKPSDIKKKYHCHNMNDVFTKVFTKRDRKYYNISIKKKEQVKKPVHPTHKIEKKQTLIAHSDHLQKILDELDERDKRREEFKKRRDELKDKKGELRRPLWD